MSALAIPMDTNAAAGAQALSQELWLPLLTYAQQRLRAGQGMDILRQQGLSDPRLMQGFAVGYLPSHVAEVLSTAQRTSLGPLATALAGCIVFPACDAAQQVVDVATLDAAGHFCPSLCAQPRGLLGAKLLGPAEQARLVTDIPSLAAAWLAGHQDIVWARGLENLRTEAPRLRQAGVRQVLVPDGPDARAMVAVLQQVGIFAGTGATAQTPRSLRLVQYNEADGVALFVADPLRYAVTIDAQGRAEQQVIIRLGSVSHRDRVALSVRAQCERCARAAGALFGIDPAIIADHVLDIGQQLQARLEPDEALPLVVLDEDRRNTTESLLKDPELLDLLCADVEALGWVGTRQDVALLLLSAYARLVPDPVWMVYSAEPGAKPWAALGLIAALTPPEQQVVLRQVTAASLQQADPRMLRHKLILIDRAESLRADAALTLRALAEWGSLGWRIARAQRAGAGVGSDETIPTTETSWTGMPCVSMSTPGPFAVLAAAQGPVDLRCRDAFVCVRASTGPRETGAHRQALAQQAGRAPAAESDIAAIVARHHAVARALRPASVLVPFAERIQYPQRSPADTQRFAQLLGLIQACAVLHQHQRARQGASVVASEADFHAVCRLTAGWFTVAGDGLSDIARRLLSSLVAAQIQSATVADLRTVLPQPSAYALRAAAEELVVMGYASATGGGRGKQRVYTLSAQASGPVLALTDASSKITPQSGAVRA